MAKLMINKNKKEGTIAPEIYGHFSEHLGRCIYEGLYVKSRMLMGCVQMWWKHSKRLRFRYCAGRGDVLRTSITGKTESDRKRTGRK